MMDGSDELCKDVQCGKGSCEAAPGSPFQFKCNCENGWKRTRLDNEGDLEFLPCIIPNCMYEFTIHTYIHTYGISIN